MTSTNKIFFLINSPYDFDFSPEENRFPMISKDVTDDPEKRDKFFYSGEKRAFTSTPDLSLHFKGSLLASLGL